MDLQNTPFTVQLGQGASIRFANAIIDTGRTGATIQFGSLDPAVTAAATAVIPAQGQAVRPQSTGSLVRRANQPAQAYKTSASAAGEMPQGRTSVFERLGQPGAQSQKRTVIRQRVFLMPRTAVAPAVTESLTTGRYDAEASSSGGKLTRRQRRKLNAELRAQNLLPEPQNTPPALQHEATIPTHNKFDNLKWVKRNSSTGEIKQSFWTEKRQAPPPPPKRPETLSARVHRVLKVAKKEGLMKRKLQRPLSIKKLNKLVIKLFKPKLNQKN